jgi:hypothetical protein
MNKSNQIKFPAGAEDFSFLHNMKIIYEAHPTSSLRVTGGYFPKNKTARA